MSTPRLVCFVDALNSDYVGRVVQGMNDSLQPQGWALDVHEAGALTMEARMALLAREAKAGVNSAAAFVHLHLTYEQEMVFKHAAIPMGYLGGSLDGADCVLDDGFEGASMGAQYLAELGHRRISFLVGDRLVTEARVREAGIMHGLRSANNRISSRLTLELKPSRAKEGMEAAMKLLQSKDRPSAIFCVAGDLVASGVYEAAAKLGLKIPDDLSVLGYDDLPLAAALDPPLSTLHVPLELMGAHLAAQLVASAEEGAGHQAEETLIKPILELRKSCAPPR